MHISFDLDSTLIPHGKEFASEKCNRLAKALGIEEVRQGTRALIEDLQKQGHTVHIYTTSFRTKSQIRRTLKYHGIQVHRIVNQRENQRVLHAQNMYASKYPLAFGFDVHVDDSKGVELEGERFGFPTIIVAPSDRNWIEKIKKGIHAFGELERAR